MELSIIIVNWNSRDYLRKCLTSIRRNLSDRKCEIIVIDSASYDGCEEMLREDFPEVRFIQSDKNLGFAMANNQAFNSSVGQYVLFLNPDTEVVGTAIVTMLERLKTLPSAGSVGCKLLNTDGSIQTSCIQSFPTILNQILDSEFLRKRWPKANMWGMAPLYAKEESPSAVEAISGACVMLKREVFEEIGRFSEDYFMYSEDVDLSFKILEAGYQNYFLPDAIAVHHGGGSSATAVSNFAAVMTREAIWRFLRKTSGRTYALGYRAGVLVTAFVRLALLLLGYPAHKVGQRGGDWSGSFWKWSAILRWSFFPQAWVRKKSQMSVTSVRDLPSAFA